MIRGVSSPKFEYPMAILKLFMWYLEARLQIFQALKSGINGNAKN